MNKTFAIFEFYPNRENTKQTLFLIEGGFASEDSAVIYLKNLDRTGDFIITEVYTFSNKED